MVSGRRRSPRGGSVQVLLWNGRSPAAGDLDRFQTSCPPSAASNHRVPAVVVRLDDGQPAKLVPWHAMADAPSKQRLLLLCTTTGYQMRAFVDAAEKLGLEVIFATDRCHV